jgi:hypothetical protein
MQRNPYWPLNGPSFSSSVPRFRRSVLSLRTKVAVGFGSNFAARMASRRPTFQKSDRVSKGICLRCGKNPRIKKLNWSTAYCAAHPNEIEYLEVPEASPRFAIDSCDVPQSSEKRHEIASMPKSANCNCVAQVWHQLFELFLQAGKSTMKQLGLASGADLLERSRRALRCQACSGDLLRTH